jgi:hypothetical protein
LYIYKNELFINKSDEYFKLFKLFKAIQKMSHPRLKATGLKVFFWHLRLLMMLIFSAQFVRYIRLKAENLIADVE